MLLLVVALLPLAFAQPAGARRDDPVDLFPQAHAPQPSSGLLSTGERVWFLTRDGSGDGTTILGWLEPDGVGGSVSQAGTSNMGVPPVESSDGAVWFTSQIGGEGISDDPPQYVAAGVDPRTDAVEVTTFDGVVGPDLVAGAVDRVWIPENLDEDQGKIVVSSAGLGQSAATVETNVADLSNVFDDAPVIPGPGGLVWTLGGVDGLLPLVRVAAIDESGVAVEATDPDFLVGPQSLTAIGDEVWAPVVDRTDDVVHAFAVGVDGSSRAVSTGFPGECLLLQTQAGSDRAGTFWTPAGTTDCPSGGSEIRLLGVDSASGSANVVSTGLDVFQGENGDGQGDIGSEVVATAQGVAVGGLDGGDLGIAFVTRNDVSTVNTGVAPYLADGRPRYPMLDAERGQKVWAQGIDRGELVVVLASKNKVVTSRTGVRPIADEISLGPRKALWTQGLDLERRLQIVRVTPDGRVTVFPTGLRPTLGGVLAGVPDDRGNMWFRGVDPQSGNLVMVRVRA